MGRRGGKGTTTAAPTAAAAVGAVGIIAAAWLAAAGVHALTPPTTAPLPSRALLPPRPANATLTRFFFGSCSKSDRPQPVWGRINERARAEPGGLPADEAPLFVWLGDIVYADKPVALKVRIPATVDDLRAHYGAQVVHPDYAPFAATAHIVGVYDDHDYGMNDGDRTYDAATRAASKQLLLDFLGEPPGAPRRAQDAMYAVYRWGVAPRRVRLLLLDNRTMKDPYDAGRAQDMLGEEQWAWLARELAEESAEVTFIAAGLQIVARGDPAVSENWSRLPASQARLLALIAATRTPGVVLLSGDMHFAEINAVTCDAVGYTLTDATSSGMTHSFSGPLKEAAVRTALMASTRIPRGFWAGHNFGQVDIAWGLRPDGSLDTAATTITLAAVGVEDGVTHLSTTLVLSELQPGALPLPQRAPYTFGHRLLNGLLPPDTAALAAYTSPAAAATACAAQSPTDGFSPACAAFLASCSPHLTLADSAFYFVGHTALYGGGITVVLTLLTAPIAAIVLRRRIPGGALSGLAAVAVAYGMVWAFIASMS